MREQIEALIVKWREAGPAYRAAPMDAARDAENYGRTVGKLECADELAALLAVPVPEPNDPMETLRTLAADPRLTQPNWDSYGSQPISPAAIDAAAKFLGYRWQAVPCPDGGVQLERHDSGYDIEVTFDVNGQPEEGLLTLAVPVPQSLEQKDNDDNALTRSDHTANPVLGDHAPTGDASSPVGSRTDDGTTAD